MDEMYKNQEKKPDSQFYKWLSEKTRDRAYIGQFANHVFGKGSKYHRETMKKLPDSPKAWFEYLSRSKKMNDEVLMFYLAESFNEFRKSVKL